VKQWWVDKIITSDFLYKKNDFTASQSFCRHHQKVNYWIFQHNRYKHALVILKRSQRDYKKQCCAMLNNNKKGKLNENLSRGSYLNYLL
jgi:hypothetical protein